MTTIRPKVNTAQSTVKKKNEDQNEVKKDLIKKQEADLKQANTNKYAVVDDFKTKNIDIDGDGKFDISHGEYVVALMKAENPNIKVDQYDVSGKDGSADQGKMIDAYDQIAVNNYAAVNMSIGSTYSSKQLEKEGINGVNQGNFADKKGEIVDNFNMGDSNANTVFNAMQRVTAGGTPIFVSAGNEGKENYNLWSAANGVTAVGSATNPDDQVNLQSSKYKVGAQGLSPDGKVIQLFSAMNSGVGKYGQGTWKSQAVEDKNGRVLGYDINGDGKVDIQNSQVSGGGTLKPKNHYVIGTSFASPTTMLKETNSGGKVQQEAVVIESNKQKDQVKYEQEYNQSKNKIKNPDLDDGIAIDDSIDEWDSLA